MRTFFNLPFNKRIKRFPVDLAVFKRGHQGRYGSFEHGHSLSCMRQTELNLSVCNAIGKKALSAALIFSLFCGAFMEFPSAYATTSHHLGSANRNSVAVSAVKDIQRDNWASAFQKIGQSKDPLYMNLYLWLLFTKMETKDWKDGNYLRLTRFIRENKDWPKLSKLVLLVEGVMPYSLSNAEVLAWYNDYPPQTLNGMERYMEALMIEGKHDQARKYLENWWATTVVSRDQQREIYQKFGQFLTIDAHKKRFDYLLLNGHYDNARGIARVLENGYPELAEARIALAQNSGAAEGLLARVPSNLQKDPGLLYERLHWRREKGLDAAAIEILNYQPPSDKILNKEDWWKERHIMIRRSLEKHDYKAAYKLASNHIQSDGVPYAEAQFLSGWLALRYMQKPKEALNAFTEMYPKMKTPISKSRAAYWAGRAASDAGNRELATDWYKKAAQFRTVFYGQLAANALTIQGDLGAHEIPALSSADDQSFKNNDLVKISEIFQAAGDKDNSGRFLKAFVQSEAKAGAYRFAAEKAADMGEYSLAVSIAKDAMKDGWIMTKQAYPVVTHWIPDTNGVELALVHGIIRQESVFDTYAMSHAGAMGLMQLMPATAREVAGKMEMSFSQEWLHTRPEYNTKLGSAYLARLLRKYDNFYPLAIAAYNAGPGRVDGWIKTFGDPRQQGMDVVDWIEMIPVSETRNYVQRVTEGMYVYRLRLRGIQGQPEKALSIATK